MASAAEQLAAHINFGQIGKATELKKYQNKFCSLHSFTKDSVLLSTTSYDDISSNKSNNSTPFKKTGFSPFLKFS